MIMGNKIFCIGLNKTGTTTIGDALEQLHYRRSGWGNHSVWMTLKWHEGHFNDAMRQHVMTHDVFEDIPWPLLFRELDHLCPNARFILTRRKDPDTWLKSIQKHIAREHAWVGHYLIYGSYDPMGDPGKYVGRYLTHLEEVRSHFVDRPGKLLELCFEDGDGWSEVCDFLGHKVPADAFPHSNKAPAHERG